MSDKSVNLARLSRAFERIAHARGWSSLHRPANLAAAISVEAGELLDIFQWDNRDCESVSADADAVRRTADELADILMYVNALADALAIDLAAALDEKIAVNEARFIDG